MYISPLLLKVEILTIHNKNTHYIIIRQGAGSKYILLSLYNSYDVDAERVLAHVYFCKSERY